MLTSLNKRFYQLWLFCLVLSASPAVYFLAVWAVDKLGANPYQKLMHASGFWSMSFLLITLSITPLRRWLCFLSRALTLPYGKRLSDWNFLFKMRKSLGNIAFAYLCCHLFLYLHYDLSWNLDFLMLDLQEKTYLAFGFSAWCLCLLLAFSSLDKIRKKMGKTWRPVHRLIYPLTILSVLHIYLGEKVGEYQSLYFAGIACVLLGHRILVSILPPLKRPDDKGMAHARSPSATNPKPRP